MRRVSESRLRERTTVFEIELDTQKSERITV